MSAIFESPIQRETWMRETPSANGAAGNGVARRAAKQLPTTDAWEKTIDEIVAMQHLGRDWDGLGAVAPTEELLQSALGLVYLFQENEMEPPHAVAPSTNGWVVMVWQGADGYYCEVELSRPFHGEVMILKPGREPEHFEIPNA